MAITTLYNTANVAGLYGTVPTSLDSEVVTTELASGLSITKSADQELWAGGLLTYTVIVTNSEDETFTGVSVTDLLDTSQIELVTDSVQLDGQTITYTYSAGLLTVALPDMDSGDSATLTFQVQKV